MSSLGDPTKLEPAWLDPELISERTTIGVLFRQAARYGERVALQHHPDQEWESVSWRRLAELTTRVAARLVELRVAPGERVILMSENRLEWICCDFGIQAAGAVTVPIYPITSAQAARGVAADAGAVAAIGSSKAMAGKLEPAGALRNVASMEEDLPRWLASEADAGVLEKVEERLRALTPETTATVIYTSGTTGEPKGVVLAHRNFADMAVSSLEAFRLTDSDVTLSFLPYAHVYERMSGTFVGLAAGATIWISRGIPVLTTDIAEVRPTVMVSVPRVYEKMHEAVMTTVAEQPWHRRALFSWAIARGRRAARAGRRPGGLAESLVLKRLRTHLTGGRLRFFVSGGAPLSRDIEEFFWSAGVTILNGYGLTETNSGVASNRIGRHKFETVGVPLPGCEVKLAEDGEILVRGPGVMLGYFNKPEATAEVFEDGWFKTGDIGEIDADGFLKITDRLKELIKTAGGKYVAPQPIEARLQEDPAIERAVVIGDERPYCVALIVPRWTVVQKELGLSSAPRELLADARVKARIQERLDAVNAGLDRWERMQYFALLERDFTEESGELTPTLKVKRKVVQASYRGEIESLYQAAQRPTGSGEH